MSYCPAQHEDGWCCTELEHDDGLHLARGVDGLIHYSWDDAAVRCCKCEASFAGTRSEARSAHWEPYSNRTQALLDSGPMVCPGCVIKAIDAALAAARRAYFERISL